MRLRNAGWLITAALSLAAQDPSTISVKGKKGEELITIRNVSYEVSGGLVLRKTEHTSQVTNEKGVTAATLVEAWPIGADLASKPRWTLRAPGVDARNYDGLLLTISHDLEDGGWWSIFRLSDAQPLFHTHVPVLRVPDTGAYAGVEVPPDGDARLAKNDSLIGIVHIAESNGAVRHIELECKNEKRAALLRSYWDVRRTLTAAKSALQLVFHDAAPDVTLSIPLSASAPIQACDIVAR